MHRRLKAPSPAMVVALIALFVAFGGTGYSARNVIFSSPSKAQIIKIVRGVAPTLNVKTAAGLSTLPSGHSESGMFATAGNGKGIIGLIIDYPRPLSAAIADANVIDAHLGSATHCPGAGQADPGYLCLYNNNYDGLNGYTEFHSQGGLFPGKQGKLGVILYWGVANGGGYVGGSWTVTAP